MGRKDPSEQKDPSAASQVSQGGTIAMKWTGRAAVLASSTTALCRPPASGGTLANQRCLTGAVVRPTSHAAAQQVGKEGKGGAQGRSGPFGQPRPAR